MEKTFKQEACDMVKVKKSIEELVQTSALHTVIQKKMEKGQPIKETNGLDSYRKRVPSRMWSPIAICIWRERSSHTPQRSTCNSR